MPNITIPEAEYNGLFDIMMDVRKAREEAKRKALDNLARYKFSNFGYWAAHWVHYNRLLPAPQRQRNPFRELVQLSRQLLEDEEPQLLEDEGRHFIMDEVNEMLGNLNRLGQ